MNKSRIFKALKYYSPFLLSVIALLIIWEFSIDILKIEDYILPKASNILSKCINFAPLLLKHSIVTLKEMILGFILGSSIGFLLACLMIESSLMEKIIYPLLVISQTFPKEALAPIFLVWFGFGILPKIAIATLICFFPVAINTSKGLLNIEQNAVDLFRSYSATKSQIFFKLRLPSALPYIFAALKMAITLSAIGAIVGEFVGASEGLGYLMQVGNSQLDTELTFASLFYLGSITIVLFLIVERIEKISLKHHGSTHYSRFR